MSARSASSLRSSSSESSGSACSSGTSQKDQWYGTDAGLIYIPGESRLIADATSGSDTKAVGDAAAADTALGTTAGGACTLCEQQNIMAGACAAGAGCDALVGTDKDLCLALVTCIRATGCFRRNVTDCLCGTAMGTACATGQANGPCLAQIQAATKSTSPVANGTLLNSLTVPSGHATQLIACDKNFCAAECLGGTADAGTLADRATIDAPVGN